MTKIAAIDVLTEDDLAICWRQTEAAGLCPNDEAREFLVTWEELARPGPVSPMTEFRAQPLESAGEAAEILRREVAGTPTWPGGWRT